jgi:hypothetical protein
MRQNTLHITVLFLFTAIMAKAQISPGDLSKPHADLEGMMNCTECHVLGGKVSNEKCLTCHQELNTRIDQKKGYHASGEVNNKGCASCHSDHHGRNFEMIRFNEDEFEHQLTGYELTGKHIKTDCRECHQPDLIANAELKKNNTTFLGLKQECLACHEDVHQKTLSTNCVSCHTTEAFSPPSNFNHSTADFALAGKHRNVDCIKCHRMELRNGKNFQRFVDIPFQNCTACHNDVHDNKFGNKCTECHNENSFSVAGASKNFSHNMTGFELEGKHRLVDCKQCHVASFTTPLPHNKCASCHQDYHKREFVRNSVSPDCAECHTVNNFSGSFYTLEEHNESQFQLEGAHLATPCFACHQQSTRWRFRNIGERCVDCHEDVHAGHIDKKFYPQQTCESCHSVTRWQDNRFDHNLTEFALLGAHVQQECMACHSADDQNAIRKFENFQSLSMVCANCHQDEHHRQFEQGGITDCSECHGFENWASMDFDHNKARFKLDGKHVEEDCAACHKETKVQGEIFVLYKIKKFECIDCHQ